MEDHTARQLCSALTEQLFALTALCATPPPPSSSSSSLRTHASTNSNSNDGTKDGALRRGEDTRGVATTTTTTMAETRLRPQHERVAVVAALLRRVAAATAQRAIALYRRCLDTSHGEAAVRMSSSSSRGSRRGGGGGGGIHDDVAYCVCACVHVTQPMLWSELVARARLLRPRAPCLRFRVTASSSSSSSPLLLLVPVGDVSKFVARASHRMPALSTAATAAVVVTRRVGHAPLSRRRDRDDNNNNNNNGSAHASRQLYTRDGHSAVDKASVATTDAASSSSTTLRAPYAAYVAAAYFYSVTTTAERRRTPALCAADAVAHTTTTATTTTTTTTTAATAHADGERVGATDVRSNDGSEQGCSSSSNRRHHHNNDDDKNESTAWAQWLRRTQHAALRVATRHAVDDDDNDNHADKHADGGSDDDDDTDAATTAAVHAGVSGDAATTMLIDCRRVGRDVARVCAQLHRQAAVATLCCPLLYNTYCYAFTRRRNNNNNDNKDNSDDDEYVQCRRACDVVRRAWPCVDTATRDASSATWRLLSPAHMRTGMTQQQTQQTQQQQQLPPHALLLPRPPQLLTAALLWSRLLTCALHVSVYAACLDAHDAPDAVTSPQPLQSRSLLHTTDCMCMMTWCVRVVQAAVTYSSARCPVCDELLRRDAPALSWLTAASTHGNGGSDRHDATDKRAVRAKHDVDADNDDVSDSSDSDSSDDDDADDSDAARRRADALWCRFARAADEQTAWRVSATPSRVTATTATKKTTTTTASAAEHDAALCMSLVEALASRLQRLAWRLSSTRTPPSSAHTACAQQLQTQQQCDSVQLHDSHNDRPPQAQRRRRARSHHSSCTSSDDDDEDDDAVASAQHDVLQQQQHDDDDDDAASDAMLRRCSLRELIERVLLCHCPPARVASVLWWWPHTATSARHNNSDDSDVVAGCDVHDMRARLWRALALRPRVAALCEGDALLECARCLTWFHHDCVAPAQSDMCDGVFLCHTCRLHYTRRHATLPLRCTAVDATDDDDDDDDDDDTIGNA